MSKSVHRCPQCGEPVSPFAAGCAICGENLIAARQAHAERRKRIPAAVRAVRLPRFDDDGLALAIGLLVAICSPLMGVVFGALLAWHADSEGLIRRRSFMFGVIATGALQLALGYSLIGPLLSG